MAASQRGHGRPEEHPGQGAPPSIRRPSFSLRHQRSSNLLGELRALRRPWCAMPLHLVGTLERKCIEVLDIAIE
jgi:hypothetical protein